MLLIFSLVVPEGIINLRLALRNSHVSLQNHLKLAGLPHQANAALVALHHIDSVMDGVCVYIYI